MSSVDSRAARLLSSQGQAEWDPISPEYYAPASGLGNAGLAGLGALRGPMVFPTLMQPLGSDGIPGASLCDSTYGSACTNKGLSKS